MATFSNITDMYNVQPLFSFSTEESIIKHRWFEEKKKENKLHIKHELWEKLCEAKKRNPQPKAMPNMLSTGFALPNTEEDRRPSPQRLKKEQFWELPEHALQMDTRLLTVYL